MIELIKKENALQAIHDLKKTEVEYEDEMFNIALEMAQKAINNIPVFQNVKKCLKLFCIDNCNTLCYN